MSLPNRLRSARMTNATLGSSIDDEVGNLERALCDILGVPIDTDISAALFEVVAAGLRSIHFQDAAADPTTAGQLRRVGGELRYHDGTGAVTLGVPVGVITPYAGSAAPSGWLLCDGSAVSRTTYAALFAVIGTTYGSGDGSTTFTLPNLKGRVPVGRDAAQAEFDTLGETGGAKTHTLTVNELPSHTHTYTRAEANATGTVAGGQVVQSVGLQADTTGATGGGAAHNNLQPYLVLNYLIKH